jgi:hypothetical protein
MAERRRAQRHAISYYIQVMDASTQKIIGNLADVSTVGVMIDGLQALPVGQVLRVRMNTTQEIADALHIEFTTRVKWCKPDSLSPDLYDIGLELIGISTSSAEVLNRIVEKYGTRNTSFNFEAMT